MTGLRCFPILPTVVAILLVAVVLAGCLDGPDPTDPDGTGSPSPNPSSTPPAALWTNPYAFTLHFDGDAAYRMALEQVYTDPDTHTGPRYRIPGTETHTEVAAELLAWLDEPLERLGGDATMQRFDGETYYDLDLAPVARYTSESWCAEGARDRTRGLEFTNIVGRTSDTEIGLIIAAHWDSKRFADHDPDPDRHDEPVLGADDGAGATAAVIELARAFAESPPGMPLTFVLFDGEDGFDRRDCHPLAGSLYYAQTLSEEEKATMDGLILLDMVGNASATYHREGHSKSYGSVDSSWLGDRVWTTAAEMNVEAFVDRNMGGIVDDHIPFLHEGLFAIDIIRYESGFAPYWHTTHDDHTAIQPEGLEQVGVVVEATVRLYAEER